MQARRIVRSSILFAAAVCGLAAQAAAATTYYTSSSEGSGLSWYNSGLWNTSSTGAGGTSYSMSSSDPNNFVVVSGGLVRSTSAPNFTGNSLTINLGGQIRFKGTTATASYTALPAPYSTVYTTGSASVNFNAGPNGTAAGTGLILNGGTLDPGDASTFDVCTGLLKVAANSTIDCGNAAGAGGRVVDLEMSISGSNSISVGNAASSTNTYAQGAFLQVGNHSGSASSTFSGAWIINAYGLDTNGLNVLGMSGPLGVSTVSLATGTVFCMSGSAAYSAANSNNSQAIAALTSLSSGAGTVILGANTLTIDGGGISSYSGLIVGAGGSMNMSGSGTVVLGGANTYSGGTTLSAGSLELGIANALGSGGINVSGGTLDLHGFGQSSGAVSIAGGSIISSVGAATLTGTSYSTQSGAISVSLGGAAAALNMAGPGLLLLSGSNGYGGGTTLTAGTLQAGSLAALGAGGLTVGGGVLDLHGFGLSLPSLSGSGGTITDYSAGGGTTTLTVNQSAATTFAGVLANGPSQLLALTKSGGGILTLTGGNTYSGPTLINAGALIVNGTHTGLGGYTVSGGTLGGTGNISSAVTLNSAAFLVPGSTLGGSSAGTLSLGGFSTQGGGDISVVFSNSSASGNSLVQVNGPLTLNGTTSVNINEPNGTLGNGDYPLFAYTGALNFSSSAASLVLATSNSLSLRQIGYFDYGSTTPGIVSLDVIGNPANLTWVGGSSNVWDQNDVPNQVWWDGNGSYAADNFFASGDYVTFSGSASAGNLSVTLSGGLAPTSVTVTGTNNYTFTGPGFIQGPTGLTVIGPGSLTIANTGNSYTGGTAIQGGSIVLGVNNALPKAGTITFGSNSSSGTLDLFGFNQTVAGLAVAGGATASNQVITTSVGNATLTFSGGATPSVFGGTIQDSTGSTNGTLNLTVSAGTLDVRSGSTTYYGATTVTGGALLVNTLPNTSGMSVGAGASLTVSGGNQNLSALSNAGNASFTASSGTTTLAGLSGGGTTNFAAGAAIATLGNQTVNLANNSVLSVASGSLTAGAITGSGSLVVGPGALTLNTTNSYNGGTTVSGGGMLSIATDANLGAVPATAQPANIVLNGSVLQFTADSAYETPTINSNRGITLGATGGTINVSPVSTGAFASSTETAVQYRGIISGSGNLVVAGGAGTNSGATPYILELGGTNTYTGTTTVNNAIVAVANTGGAGPNNILPPTTVLNLVNNGWYNFDNDGESQQIAGLSGDATGIVTTTNANLANLGNLIIGPAAGLSYTFSGTIGPQTLLGKTGASGIISLTINGPGTQILAGSNTYAGATTLSAGTLQLGNGSQTGSLAAGSAITDNATLAFNRSNTATQGVDFSPAAITGSGSLAQMGPGTLLLNAANTYSGGTTISGGTLQLGDGATHNGSVIGNIANNAVLTFANPAAQTYAGAISGMGSVTKTATGTLTLSGENTYSGPTSVNLGMLSFTGSLASSSVTVASGATLTGTGNGSATGLIAGTVAVNGGGAIDFTKDGLGSTTTTLTFGGLTVGDSSSTPASLTFNLNTINAQATDSINLGGGTLTVNPSNATVNIAVSTVAPGTYNLITFGSISGAGSFTLNPADVQVGLSTLSLVSTTNALELNVAGNPTPTLAYWSGNYAASGGNANWGGFNASGPVTNWSLDAAGVTDAGQIVGPITDVVFAATSAQGPINSVLDANYIINSLTVTTTAAVSISGSQTLTINAAASGTGSLGYAAGTGIVIQPGAGPLTISANTLIPAASQSWTNNSSSLLSISSNVTGAAASGTTILILAGSGSGGSAISGAISNGANGGNLALVVDTPNAGVTLSGSNTYTGGTAILSGSIVLGANNALPTAGGIAFGSTGGAPLGSGTLDLAGFNQTVAGLAVAGGATPAGQIITASSGSSTLTFSGGGTASTFAGTIQDSGGTLALTVSSGTLNAAAGGTTYHGATTVNGGLLVASSLPNTSGINISTLGVLNLTAAGQTVTTPLSNAGNLSFTATSGTTTLPSLTSGVTSFAAGAAITTATGGTINLNGLTASIGTLTNPTVNLASGTVLGVSGGTQTAGAITGSGSLVMAGPGTLTLNATNSYSGGTTINSGILSISGSSDGSTSGNLGAVPGTIQPANITLNGGALQFTADSSYGSATISSNRGIFLGPSGGTISVLAVSSGTFATGTGETAVQYRGIISGSGNLVVTGGALANSGTGNPYIFELGAQNTYTGTTTVNNAILAFENNNDGGTGPVNILPTTTVLNLFNNGWFNENNGAASQTIAGLEGDASGRLSVTNGSSISSVTIDPAAGLSYSFSGTIGAQDILGKTGGNSILSLTIDGPGTQILAGPNTYTAATTISAGTLQLGNGGATGSLATGSAITDNATLAFNRSNTATQGADFSSAAITGSGSLVQMGPGMLVLNATNTYSGGTTVSGGTLQLGHASALGTGGVTVKGGSTLDLDGNAQSSGAVSLVSGNIISSVGAATLTGTSYSVQSGAISANLAGGAAGLAKTGPGLVSLSGANTFGGPTAVNAGILSAGALNTLSPNSAVSVGGGTLDVTAAPQTIASLTMGSSGTLNLAIGNLLTSSGSAGFNGALDLYGATSGTEDLMNFASYSGSFSTATSVPGYRLLYTPTQLDLVQNPTATTYNLAAAASASLLHLGGSTTVTATITNAGSGLADNLDYTGLSLNASGGSLSGAGLPISGGPLAQGVSNSGSQTYTASVAGTFSVAPTVASATNDTIGGSAMAGTTQLAAISVFSGSGRWIGGNGTSWGSQASPNWADVNGSGVAAAPGTFGYNDTVVLDDTGGTNTTITLDGVSPTLAALTFNSTASSYVLAQGSGTTSLILTNGTNAAVVTLQSGTNAITTPIFVAGGNLDISASNNSILSITGNIADDGLGRSLTLGGDGSGQLVLSGTDMYTGGTVVNAGTLIVDSPAALADGSSLTVGQGASAIFAPAAGPSLAAAPGGVAAVPEPGTAALALAGLFVGFGAWRRRAQC
jgi:fibronectin-binding autotransporter adhesin